jgi:hypothetical protein
MYIHAAVANQTNFTSKRSVQFRPGHEKSLFIPQPHYSSKPRIALPLVDTMSHSVVYPTVWYS